MKPVCILSVHFRQRWLDHQCSAIHGTVDGYEHVVFFNNTQPPDDDRFTVVGSQRSSEWGGGQHITGLRRLAGWACENKDRYRAFLVLDSDCFPCDPGWESRLKTRVGDGMACVLRSENFETFPHPSVVYTKDPSKLRFEHVERTNLLGKVYKELVVATDDFHPLVRVNKVNLHPVANAVYEGPFYHHGGGSRNSNVFHADQYYGPSNVADFTPDLPSRLMNRPRVSGPRACSPGL